MSLYLPRSDRALNCAVHNVATMDAVAHFGHSLLGRCIHRAAGRFRHYLLLALAWVLLIGSIGIVFMWARGMWKVDVISCQSTFSDGDQLVQKEYQLLSGKGVVSLCVTCLRQPLPSITPEAELAPPASSLVAHAKMGCLTWATMRPRDLQVKRDGFWQWLGFRAESDKSEDRLMTYSIRRARVPHWFLFLVILMSLSLQARKVLQRQRTRRLLVSGMCPNCGYDLRGIPERCPECGKARE